MTDNASFSRQPSRRKKSAVWRFAPALGILVLTGAGTLALTWPGGWIAATRTAVEHLAFVQECWARLAVIREFSEDIPNRLRYTTPFQAYEILLAAMCLPALLWSRRRAMKAARLHHRAQVALRDTEWFYQTAVDGLPAQIAVLDEKGVVLFANKAWRDFKETDDSILPRTPESQNFLIMCDQASGRRSKEAANLAAAIRRLIAGRAETLEFESSGRTVNAAAGEEDQSCYLCRLSRFPDPNAPELRSGGRVVISFDDISQRKLAEATARKAKEAADAANEAKSAFLANMSHELRTPMTAILGYADLMLDEGQDPRERSRCASIIRRNGEHLLALINDVLDLSKIEAQMVTVERIPCDPMQVISDVMGLMRVRANDKKLDLHVEFDGPIPAQVVSDPLRLRQILVNLVGNAIKFTAHGSVRLRVACQVTVVASTLQIDVVDTGIGLSEKQIAKLFKPFTQGDTSTTRQHGGTGLGLSISLKLAQLLGGGITVRSEAGAGSTFSVWIETGSLQGTKMRQGVSEADLTVAPAAAAAPPRAMRFEGKVLLAEDCEDNRDLIASYLTSAGIEVVTAGNGVVAVELAFKENVDLVLMDMQMPEMDGVDAARALRSQSFAKPIVALTANVMTEDRARCTEAGCNEFVTKPIDRDRFFAVLGQFLKSAPIPVAPPPAAATSSASTRGDDSALRSRHAGDSRHADILERFIKRLPDRVAELTRLVEQENMAQLEQAVHKLKGAAGGYGFPQITDAATRAEQAIRGQVELHKVVEEIDNLVRLISRVDGYPGQAPADAAPTPKLRVDAITGLFNFRYLNERLPTELSLARRNNRPLAVVKIRLPGFDGDQQKLRSIGGILLARCQGEHIGFRIGEADFLLVLPGCNALQAEAIVQLVYERVNESENLKITFTIAEADAHTLSTSELLAGLDRPMQEN